MLNVYSIKTTKRISVFKIYIKNTSSSYSNAIKTVFKVLLSKQNFQQQPDLMHGSNRFKCEY